MAEAIKNKFYFSDQGIPPSVQVLPGYNTPHGYQEVSDYAGLNAAAKKLLDYQKSQIDLFTTRYGADSSGPGSDTIGLRKKYDEMGGDALYQALSSNQGDPTAIAKLFGLDESLVRGFQGGNAGDSKYVVDPVTGNMTTKEALDGDAYWKDQVAKGLAKEVKVGNGIAYIPTGSPADLQMQGKSFEEQMATPSVQKFIQDNKLNPVDPNAKPTTPAGTPAPVITPEQALTQAISQVYATRPDLQALYNPDGSAKNPKDPKVAGIPTLSDWARKFGVNESPLIKTALNTPAASASPDGSLAGGTGAGSGTSPDPKGAASTGAGVAGVSDFQSTYTKVYNDLGLKNIKDQYNDFNKQILDLKNELNDKISEINSDPWLSEGVRVARVQKMNEKYEGRLTNLTNFLTIANNLYQEGMAEAKFLTTGIRQEVADQEARAEANKAAAADIADNYAVTTPWFNKGGTFVRVSDGKAYKTAQEFFADAGVSSFQEAREKGLYTDIDPNKQVERAQVLDLMATYNDAGIRPTDTLEVAEQKLQRSKIYADKIRGPAGTEPGILPSDTKVRNWLYDNKKSNPDKQWYDLWGILADEMEANGQNPANYDKYFWEILHPEGLAGYDKFVKNADDDNPFK